MSKKYVGIDIGINGGIAVLEDNDVKLLQKMPVINTQIDVKALREILEEANKENDCHFVFEKLGLIYKSSKRTAFSMGYQLGIIEGICVSKNFSYTEVRAVDWQKAIYQGIPEVSKSNGKRDTKAMALIAANRIFPSVNFKKSQRATKPDDGLIDALLIAEYARRKNF
jgi:type IV secretory pathway VirJ component